MTSYDTDKHTLLCKADCKLQLHQLTLTLKLICTFP